jgi:hypothetical protein
LGYEVIAAKYTRTLGSGLISVKVFPPDKDKRKREMKI